MWRPPKQVTKSDLSVRPDQDNHIDASEYLDDEETLQSKVIFCANLLRKANHCVCYTGAGISKSAGISDYATRAVGSISATGVSTLSNPLNAQPTLAHDALASMYRSGFIKEFVNQNHDALFEKAGVHVKDSNLIHGDWFDIANPVVQFSGTLRSDLFYRLLKTDSQCDLVIVAGTSLSGMNADRIAHNCAKKWEKKTPGILGTILVNLQKTCLDDKCVVRVWCKTDVFFNLLAEELNVSVEHFRPDTFSMSNSFEIPYDENGKITTKEHSKKMILDLSPGARLKIVHPDASNIGSIYTIENDKDSDGNWIFGLTRPGKFAIKKRFGRWYVQAALNGEMEQFPCVNEIPQFVNCKCESCNFTDKEKKID